MAAESSEYKFFLRNVLQDADLQNLDPKDFASALQIHDVINADEHEQLSKWIEGKDDRRLVGLTSVHRFDSYCKVSCIAPGGCMIFC